MSVYVVRQVRKVADTPAEVWARGLTASSEGPWWYQILEDSGLEDQFSFHYAVVERDGQPVAVAPLFVADVPIELVVPDELMPVFRLLGRLIPSLLVQRTLFVGSVCSDQGDVAILPGEDRAGVLLAVARSLDALARAEKAPMLVWKDFPDAYRADMAAVCGQAGFFTAPSFPGAEVAFSGADKESYFAGMKSSHRQQLRKKLRRSVEKSDLELSTIQHPSDAQLDEILGLFMQTYEKAETRFERLDRHFFEATCQHEQSHFILLRDRADEKLVAFMLCFDLGKVVINKFIGIDYAKPKDWMLYFRLTEAAIDWALSKGAARLQSGQTGYRVKIELGHSLVPLTNYGRHRNPLVHAVYAQVAKTINWSTLDPDLAKHLAAHPDNPTAAPGRWSHTAI
jgi:hypothetical protein